MSERTVLHSWKEISKYTGVGVRTVQRYETQLGLPVHRPAERARGKVLAFCDEIDSWLSKAPTRADMNEAVPQQKLTEEHIAAKR
jgi:hypothetical protein